MLDFDRTGLGMVLRVLGIIALGAVMGPRTVGAQDAAATAGSAKDAEYSEFERSHWSFQPIARAVPPSFRNLADRTWSRNPLDAFVLRRLRAKGLSPSPPASRRELIRRVTYQLTGLPPTPEDVRAFVNDPRPQAYEQLVDRLLASPKFGEKFGQLWLDVVRFSETEGFEYDRTRHGAWRYRDYVIRSLNQDRSYARFIREQLAGDELPRPTANQLAASGFHRLGPIRRNAGNPKVAFSRNEVLTERTDAVGAVFLGLTVGCARCHDHMFDPIRQRDYYQLQAFLASSFESNRILSTPAEKQAWESLTKRLEQQIKGLKEKLVDAPTKEAAELRDRIAKLTEQLPEPLRQISAVRNEPDKRSSIRLLQRGNEDLGIGPPLGMRFLGVLLPEKTAALSPTSANPRTRLADWITGPRHPLTPRVITNRIWQFYFLRGLVPTSNDFGINGQPPSHPQLLDFLARKVIDDGWQLKRVHRMILLSNTYRQSSRSTQSKRATERDASNEYLWRFPRRRLQAEEIRDSMLQISGRAYNRMAGPSVMVPIDKELVKLLYKPTQWQVNADPAEHHRRSIYLMAKRNLRHPFLQMFDQPDTQTSCFQRESSTHAPQALEMLNGRLANGLSVHLAARLRLQAGEKRSAQIQLAFELATGRPPTKEEAKLSQAFLARNSLREFALAVLNLNAFLYVD